MTLPHTYTDEADDTLTIIARPGPRIITNTIVATDDEQGVIEHVASVTAPKGADAVALAKAVLEAAGDTGHVVISTEELSRRDVAAAKTGADIGSVSAARSMCDRAQLLVINGVSGPLAHVDDASRAQAAAAIRALPLLPDA